MEKGTNRSNRTILIVIFGCLAFCCLGSGILGFFGYKSGTKALEEDAKYLTKVMTTLSDSNYEVSTLETFLPNSSMNEVTRKQWEPVMQMVRDRLGKFKSLGAAKKILFKNNNGVVIHEVAYAADFEKANGIVKAAILRPGTTEQSLYGITFNSSVFNDLFKKSGK